MTLSSLNTVHSNIRKGLNRPAPPTELTLSGTPTTSSVTFTFTAPAGLITNYTAYYNTSNSFAGSTQYATSITESPATVNELTHNTLYYIFLVANAASGASINSSSFSATTAYKYTYSLTATTWTVSPIGEQHWGTAYNGSAIGMAGAFAVNNSGATIVARGDQTDSNQTYSNSIYVSTNNFASISAAKLVLGRGGTSVACSDNAQYILAGHSDLVTPALFLSTNTGSTWTYPTFANTATNVCSVSMSSSGQYQLAGIGGHTVIGGITTGAVYVSSDFGSSWTSNLASANWQASGMSSTGQYMWVGSADTKLYTSNNYGSTWTPVIIPGSTSVYATSGTGGTSVYANKIAVSTDGTIVALTSNTTLCVSTNRGNTWNITNAAYNSNFNNGGGGQNQSYGMQMSNDGGLIITATYGSGNLYYSTNYGVTWTLFTGTTKPNLINAFGISGNGTYIYAGDGWRGGSGLLYYIQPTKV